MKSLTLFALLAIGLAYGCPAQAQVQISPSLSYVSFPGVYQYIYAEPDGDNTIQWSGTLSIGVRLRDVNGNVVANYPRTYIALGCGNLHNCLLSNLGYFTAFADANTDQYGRTTISLASPFYCGGQSAGLPFDVYVRSAPGDSWRSITNTSGDSGYIRIRTPDLTGDGVVNSSDLDMFAAILNGGVYDKKADMNFDGRINLTDASYIVNANGDACP